MKICFYMKVMEKKMKSFPLESNMWFIDTMFSPILQCYTIDIEVCPHHKCEKKQKAT
jgi:hypothetical protein